VLFGGAGAAFPYLADTWEWDGTDWVQRAPANAPGGRYGHALAYDGARGRVVLFAGYFGPQSDTWEWDGTTWFLRPVVGPSPRFNHAMAYDSARGRVVLFGAEAFAEGALADTWEYWAPCDVVGRGHASGSLPIACAPPRVGTTFCVSFSDPPPIGAGLHALVVGPAPPLGAPAVIDPPEMCSRAFLHVAPQLVLTAVGNPASFCVSFPAGPGLIGLAFCLQGASFEVAGCFRATDALAVVIQP
jgi:hypothetical protein